MLVMLLRPDQCVKLHQWILLGLYEFLMITHGHSQTKVFFLPHSRRSWANAGYRNGSGEAGTVEDASKEVGT